MKNIFVKSTAFIACLFAAQVFAQDIPETITVTSSVFDHHGTVPEENSAYADNVSIDLNWSNLPAGTEQLALIMDDPIVVDDPTVVKTATTESVSKVAASYIIGRRPPKPQVQALLLDGDRLVVVVTRFDGNMYPFFMRSKSDTNIISNFKFFYF